MADRKKASYNEAMAEWSAKQSFFRNPANRIIHPDPTRPLPLRIFGYLFRLAIIASVFFGGSFFVLNKNLKEPKFSTAVGKNLAEVLHASDEDLEHSGIRWQRGMGRVGHFIAKGTDDAFFHDIELRAIEFEASLLALFTSKWNFSSILIDEMKLNLRSGGKVEVKEVSQGQPHHSLHQSAAGFLSPEPDLAKATFSSIKVRNANIYWGQSPATRGSITGATMAFIPGRDATQWRLEFTGGILSQNWWKKIQLRSLTVRREPGKLVFEDGQLALGEGGEGFLAGEVATGSIPRINLRLEFASMPSAFILPRSLSNFLDYAVLSGTNNIQGSINLRSGVEHTIEATLQNASPDSKPTIHDFPPLDAMALITEHTPFRRFPITSGSIQGHSREGTFNLKALDLESVTLGKISANLSVQDPKSASQANQSIGSRGGKTEKNSGEGQEDIAYPFSGELSIGALSAIIDDPASPLIRKYLGEERDGHFWLKVPLDGSLEEINRLLMQRVRRDVSAQ